MCDKCEINSFELEYDGACGCEESNCLTNELGQCQNCWHIVNPGLEQEADISVS